VVDGGSENIKDMIALLNRIEANCIQISLYNSRVNGAIERGHYSILAVLSKMTNSGLKHWWQYLYSVLLAERITTYQPTGIDPFLLVYGRECVLLAESRFLT
jgi:hypothetical protein